MHWYQAKRHQKINQNWCPCLIAKFVWWEHSGSIIGRIRLLPLLAFNWEKENTTIRDLLFFLGNIAMVTESIKEKIRVTY